MDIEFDSTKRDKTLMERGLDFCHAHEVFAGRHFTAEDTRASYGELRYITVGKLKGRMILMPPPAEAGGFPGSPLDFV